MWFFQFYFWAIVIVSPNLPNDSIFKGDGSTLFPVNETSIELRKEVLEFRFDKSENLMHVTVKFKLFNPDSARVDTVGFVSNPAYYPGKENAHPQFQSFRVKTNGAKTGYKVIRMDSSGFTSPNEKEIDGHDYIYYFTMKFRNGFNTISHSYEFHGSASSIGHRDFSYRLTTGKLWANGQIDDFNLRVIPGNSIFTLPTCFETNCDSTNWSVNGTGKFKLVGDKLIGYSADNQTIFEYQEKKFAPDLDLNIGLQRDFFMGSGYKNLGFYFYETEDTSFLQNAFNLPVWENDKKLKEQLRDYTEKELRIIRNALFALQGYKFKSEDLHEFFLQFPWYIPDENVKNAINELSTGQKKLLKLIQEVEKEKQN